MSAGLVASKWHDGQMYGTRPYMYHIRQVVKRVSDLPALGDDYIITQMVAYLHDIFEDTDCTESDIRASLAGYPRMNDLIDAIVAITKLPSETRSDYLKRVKTNSIALTVKKADTLANLEESTFHQPNAAKVDKYTKQLRKLCE